MSSKCRCYEWAGNMSIINLWTFFKCSIRELSLRRFGLWKKFKFPKERLLSAHLWSNTNPFSQVPMTQVTSGTMMLSFMGIT